MKGQETGSLPDNLRCNRTDGRQWRCRRRAMDGKKLCGIHQIQLRHRQHKEKVPESLKLKRKRRRTIDSGIRVCTTKQVKKRRELGQNAESVGVSEALDGAVKRMKLRKGDLQLDLIRSFLQRQVERRRVDGDLREGSEGELMRDLPNGLMSICSTPLPDHIGNAGSCRMKLGGDPSPSPFAPRRFRSKNIEPLPIGTMQIVPYQKNVENLRKHGRKKCHWCQKSVLRNLIKCSSCEEEVFCVDCIKQQYFGTEDEVRVACPVCRRACSCKTCLLTQSKDVE